MITKIQNMIIARCNDMVLPLTLEYLRNQRKVDDASQMQCRWEEERK